MKKNVSQILCLLAVVFLLPVSAQALPPWKAKFKDMFVDDGPKTLQEAFADNVIGSCKVCHVNDKPKTVRNPFGEELDKLIEGSASQRLKDAAKVSADAKKEEQAKIDKELATALEKVWKMASPSGGGTYGERLKAGRLPFVPGEGPKPNTLTEAEKVAGWKLLFDGKTATGWNSWKTKKPLELGQWKVEDGALTLTQGGGDIYTADAYENFELELEWKTTGNSGILIRVNPELAGPIYKVAPEIQIDRTMGKSKTSTAAIYDIYAIENEAPYHQDGWNKVRIRMVNGEGTHWFNGQKVHSYKIGSDDWNQRIANSKWKNTSGFGETAKGNIGLQDHGATVSFRNLKIREIAVEIEE